ncbi:AAA family ATPase [Salinilacihabitans rarus]|uniref:AAA family ATPase n=1 Tax=Salinilacihabitans rarus TaxID=2961596 RepID=UPI0020C876DD|nr:AAA family ATPase [Salinilacihabitans rarus]
MDLRERIARRQSAHGDRGIVVDRDHLSPVVHRPQPIGRGPVLERCLDALEPIFDGDLPPPIAVVGPPGAGTSAVVTALFAGLGERLGGSRRAIATTTRGGSETPTTWFVYVDSRRTESAFAFYRAVLSALSSETVPTGGVGTDDLRDRLRTRLDRPARRAVVAIDHHDEPATLSYGRARELLDPVADSVSTVAVGVREPADWSGETVSVPAYRRHELVDVLTERASAGLAAGAFDHGSIRDLARWADGNAHDGLAALFGTARLASEAGADRLEPVYFEEGKAAVPPDSVHVGRALALSETRRRVLLELVDREPADRPIGDLAADVAAGSSLTTGTVKRLLYELADRGVLERRQLPSNGSGRRPSTVEPRFPTLVYRALVSEPGDDGEI